MLNDPRQSTLRHVIDFKDWSEEVAATYPEPYAILLDRVKPERQKCNRERRRMRWWQFGEVSPGLRAATAGKNRLLMHSFTGKHFAFSFIPATVYVASPHIAIALEANAAFCALQARTHETWTRFFSSSMKDDLRYAPSDCFETFPFPPDFETNPALEAAGKAYYEFRTELMVRNNEGLTKTYNRFHDESETSPDIHKLRELHAAMDRAVLKAYGWTDIPTACEFIPDYFETDDDGNEVPKSLRYRWPDPVRDEVLARLLDLNQKRYDEEVRLGLHAKAKGKGAKGAKKNKKEKSTPEGELFANQPSE